MLTAAHCTRAHPNPNTIMAYAGDHDLMAGMRILLKILQTIYLQELTNTYYTFGF